MSYRLRGFGDAAATAIATPLVITPTAPMSATQSTLVSLYSWPLTQLCKVMPQPTAANPQPAFSSICEGGFGFNPVAIVLPGLIWGAVAYVLFFRGRR
jgi:hypothetical protein